MWDGVEVVIRGLESRAWVAWLPQQQHERQLDRRDLAEGGTGSTFPAEMVRAELGFGVVERRGT